MDGLAGGSGGRASARLRGGIVCGGSRARRSGGTRRRPRARGAVREAPGCGDRPARRRRQRWRWRADPDVRRRTDPDDGRQTPGREGRRGGSRPRHGAGHDSAAGPRKRPPRGGGRGHPRDHTIRCLRPPHPLAGHGRRPRGRGAGDHRDHPAVDPRGGPPDREAPPARHAAGDEFDSARRARAGHRPAHRPHESRRATAGRSAAAPGGSIRGCEAGTRRGARRLSRPCQPRQGTADHRAAGRQPRPRRDPDAGQGGAGSACPQPARRLSRG